MAYQADCNVPRVNVFSNPDRMYNNRPQGSATTDNARVIRDGMVSVFLSSIPSKQRNLSYRVGVNHASRKT